MGSLERRVAAYLGNDGRHLLSLIAPMAGPRFIDEVGVVRYRLIYGPP
jgi:hypothetical protein